MIVNGMRVTIESEQVLETWMRTKKDGAGFRASDLVAQVCALESREYASEAMRIADRLIQKHKRLGNIKLRGANNWCWSS